MLDWGGNVVIVGVPAPTAEFTSRVTFMTHVERGVIGPARPAADGHAHGRTRLRRPVLSAMLPGIAPRAGMTGLDHAGSS